MFANTNITTNDNKDDFYKQLLLIIKGIIEDENDVIANLANVSAVLYNYIDNINWAGFYLFKEKQLILGPFQGKPACIRIPIGRGVCGVAAYTKQIQIVKNVHEFCGHIACDSDSNSEIVIPMIFDDRLMGVLDIDSPLISRFDSIDGKYLSQLVNLIVKQCKWD